VNDLSEHTDGRELDWLAFQYVSGELSEHDSAGFEEQLANDPSACEAVARQVMICEAVATLEPQTISPAEVAPVTLTKRASSVAFVPTDSSMARWIGVAITAASLAIAMWAGLFSAADQVETLAYRSTSQPDASQLVQSWVDVKPIFEDRVDLQSSRLDELNSDELNSWSDDEFGGTNELVPDWMLAAVSKSDIDEDLDMPVEARE